MPAWTQITWVTVSILSLIMAVVEILKPETNDKIMCWYIAVAVVAAVIVG